jgi:hypothetical protein
MAKNNKKNTMLPGFYVNIEDTNQSKPAEVKLKDVYTIFGILPEKMKTRDEDGEIEEVFIEPNEPIMLSSAQEAIETLENNSLVLTREIKNIIRLIPDGSNIAVVRIVKRNGDEPDPNSLTDMHEALDFAFENLENFQTREIILAGISLDNAVALDPNKVQVKEIKNSFEGFDKIIKGVFPYNTTAGIIVDKKFDLSIKGTKSANSAGETDDGIHDTFEVKINGETAKVITEDGSKDFKFNVELTYTGVTGSKTYTINSQSQELKDYIELKVEAGKLVVEIKKDIMIKLDDETIVKLKDGKFNVKSDERTKTEVISSYNIVKLSDDASILRRTLIHNLKITTTQNPCYTFLSPTPPKSLSKKDIANFVERCQTLKEKIREQSTITDSKGKRIDLGKFLSVPIGVNQYDGLGGLSGFPQAKIATINNDKVITKKATTSFSVGDKVEVYTHNKLDVLIHSTTVKKVVISDTNSVEITLNNAVPSEISTGLNPKYIMNINNKDFNGNYLARQYSNICREAGVDRSPAGLIFPGECQLKFSDKQLQLLDSLKFCVLQQEQAQSVGSVSRSQLMTSYDNVFQKIDTLNVVYKLIQDSKDILMPYKGKRINEGTELALIKTELEDTVFKPAVNEFIMPNFSLNLIMGRLTQPNGVKERTMFMDFSITEIETLQNIRMNVKVL